MTVRIEKPAINVREELADLRKPSGIAGEAMLRAETPQEQFNLIGAGRKNVLINGDFKINQRNNLPFTGAVGYAIDRWKCAKTYGGWSISESTGHAAETGHNTAIKIDCTSTATMSSTQYAELQYRIEGSDVQHLQWGGSKGKPITLSFWVKSNLTGLYSLTSATGANLYNTSYTIDAPNTWEKKYITISPLTTASIPDGTGTGLLLEFWVALGSTYTTGATSWGSSPKYGRNGQVNFMSSTDNEFYITGVQLELGKVATPFEHRSYGEELAACQRYYYQTDSSNKYRFSMNVGASTTSHYASWPHPVTMRAEPTVSITATTTDNWSSITTSGDNSTIALGLAFNPNGTADTRCLAEFHFTANAEL